ncbi:MAG: alginate export family protein, partial [Bryobacteraceae bacterium]|nr:alginate export family protein [Bryobacteraceae bacterium]
MIDLTALSASGHPALALILALVTGFACSAQSLEPLNAKLRRYVLFSGEYRVRWEGFSGRGFRPENDDHYLLNRYRLNLELRPVPNLTLFAQAQDARVFWNTRVGDVPPLQDRLDLRLAFVRVGNPDKSRLAAQVGRQEIRLGEERLLGTGNWANSARSFDAVRLYWNPAAHARFEIFAAAVAQQTEDAFNRRADGDNIHAVIGHLQFPGTLWEPFGLWRLSPRVRSESGRLGKQDIRTYGLRLAGSAGKQNTYVSEMAY